MAGNRSSYTKTSSIFITYFPFYLSASIRLADFFYGKKHAIRYWHVTIAINTINLNNHDKSLIFLDI